MGRSRTLSVMLVASSVLAGCATTKFLDISPADKLPQRLELRGFSIAPPTGPGWYWIAGFTGVLSVTGPKADFSKQSRVLFAQGDQNWGATPSNFPPPDKEGYRIFAFATAVDLGDRRFANSEEFRRFTEEHAERVLRRRLTGVTDRRSLRLIDASVVSTSIPGSTCVRYRLTGEDAEDPHFQGSAMTLATQGVQCLHPHWPQTVVDARVTQWFPKGKPPRAVDAETFLGSVAFAPTRPLTSPPQLLVRVPLPETLKHPLLGYRPVRALAVGAGAVWATQEQGVVLRLNTATGATDTVAIGGRPEGLALGDGSVWIANKADDTVLRLDPVTTRIMATIPVGREPVGVAVGFGSVWVTNSGAGTVSRLDRASNRVVATIPVGQEPDGLAIGEDAVWVANRKDGTVTAIDPQTNRASGPIAVGRDPRRLAVGESAVWVTSHDDGVLSRIDPQARRVIATIPVGRHPMAVAVTSGRVLVHNLEGGQTVATVSVIDPRINEEVTERWSQLPLDASFNWGVLVPAETGVWVGTGMSLSVGRKGSVLYRIGLDMP